MSFAPAVTETRRRAEWVAIDGPGGVASEGRRRVARSSSTAGAKRPRLRTVHLVGLVVALAVLFVIAPASLAGGDYGRSFTDNGTLVDATRTSVAEFWSAGSGHYPPALQSAVDYWARYHLAKALIAVLLLAALLVLGARVWRIRSRPEGLRGSGTSALTAALVGIAMLALVAVVLVAANIQGATSPFTSLLSLLGPEQRAGDLAPTVDQIRQALAQPAAASGPHALALNAIVDDFARYHAVFATLAAALAAGFGLVGVVSWRARRSAKVGNAGARRLLSTFAGTSIALALLMLVVAAANVSNATAPENGLRIFFGGV